MQIEILTEDKSGAVVVKRLVEAMLRNEQVQAQLAVRPHRGCGSFPRNPDEKPAPFASALLDLLPAKCRAYDKVYKGTDMVLVVIMDSDDHDPKVLKEQLKRCCDRYAPHIKNVIGLCTEEIEAWLLGDKEAVMLAYPEADEDAFDYYEQDSVCGTWEKLCRIVCPDNFEDILEIGYPAIGSFKARWADSISMYMNPELNVSPSFISFKEAFKQIIDNNSIIIKHHTRSF